MLIVNCSLPQESQIKGDRNDIDKPPSAISASTSKKDATPPRTIDANNSNSVSQKESKVDATGQEAASNAESEVKVPATPVKVLKAKYKAVPPIVFNCLCNCNV